jgi:hypothetical protein
MAKRFQYKVFRFSYNGSYGSHTLLIAAENQATAQTIKEESNGGSRYDVLDFDEEIESLRSNVRGIILDEGYIE